MNLRQTTAAFALVAAFLFQASTLCNADTISISGIMPFDQNLGSLDQVQVFVPGRLINTSVHEGGFSSISSHTHIVNSPGVGVAGLGIFDYATVQTSVENPSLFEDHFHTVNFPAFQNNFSATQLNWFLNPANPTVGFLNFPSFQTSTNEDHSHFVGAFSVVPTTTFTFTPNAVPEPNCGLILAFGLLFASRQRNRC